MDIIVIKVMFVIQTIDIRQPKNRVLKVSSLSENYRDLNNSIIIPHFARS